MSACRLDLDFERDLQVDPCILMSVRALNRRRINTPGQGRWCIAMATDTPTFTLLIYNFFHTSLLLHFFVLRVTPQSRILWCVYYLAKMRLSSLREFSQLSPPPAMPAGLVELMEGLTREVLRHNPSDVQQFCASHMKKLLEIRDGPSHLKPLTLEQKIAIAQRKVRRKAKERRERFDQQFKLESDKGYEDGTAENIPDSNIQEPIIPILKEPVRYDLEHASEIEISQMQHGDQTSSYSPKAMSLGGTENLHILREEGAENSVDTNVDHAQILNGSESVLSEKMLDELDKSVKLETVGITEKCTSESQSPSVLQTLNLTSTSQEKLLEPSYMITPEPTPFFEYEVSVPENVDKNLIHENIINKKMEPEDTLKTIELTIPENTESIDNHGISNICTVEISVTDTTDNGNNMNVHEIITENVNDKDTPSGDTISEEQTNVGKLNIDTVLENQISSNTNNTLKMADVKITSTENVEKVAQINTNSGSSVQQSNDFNKSIISEALCSKTTTDKHMEISNVHVTDSENVSNQNNFNINNPTEKLNKESHLDVNSPVGDAKDKIPVSIDTTVKLLEIDNLPIRDHENSATNSKVDAPVDLVDNHENLPNYIVNNVGNVQNTTHDVENDNNNVNNLTLNDNGVSVVNNDTGEPSVSQIELSTELVEERRIVENSEVENDASNKISTMTHDTENHANSIDNRDKIELNEEHLETIDVQDLKFHSREKEDCINDDYKIGKNNNNAIDEIIKSDGSVNTLCESHDEAKSEDNVNGEIKSNNYSALTSDIKVKKVIDDQENGEENDENVNTDVLTNIIAVNLKPITKEKEPIADEMVASDKSLESSQVASQLQEMGDNIEEENRHSLRTDDSVQNDPNNMDLETAAVTIQKVFRSFMFKSRNSTFEDSTHDENNSLDEDNDKKENYYVAANISKERRPLGITRMDTVLQTVNEEKSLSLSTDDSSTLSSAATTIQAHVRGFLVRSRRNSNRTVSMNSLVNSHETPEETEQQKNKTILNIHIVPEEGHYLSRDESLITSMDLSLDASPPSSVNLHPLGYDTSERRKMLKREDAIQSISPPSNNSGKLSEDSVKEILINDEAANEAPEDKLKSGDYHSNDLDNASDIVSESTSTTITVINECASEDSIKSTMESHPNSLHGKMNCDEADVVTPFESSPRSCDVTPRLEHSGEFHDLVLPTKVSRADSSVARGE